MFLKKCTRGRIISVGFKLNHSPSDLDQREISKTVRELLSTDALPITARLLLIFISIFEAKKQTKRHDERTNGKQNNKFCCKSTSVNLKFESYKIYHFSAASNDNRNEKKKKKRKEKTKANTMFELSRSVDDALDGQSIVKDRRSFLR